MFKFYYQYYKKFFLNLFKIFQILFDFMFLDEKYKVCYELYRDVEEVFEESDLDMLEKLIFQYYVMKDIFVFFIEVFYRRMEVFKEGNCEL